MPGKITNLLISLRYLNYLEKMAPYHFFRPEFLNLVTIRHCFLHQAILCSQEGVLCNEESWLAYWTFIHQMLVVSTLPVMIVKNAFKPGCELSACFHLPFKRYALIVMLALSKFCFGRDGSGMSYSRVTTKSAIKHEPSFQIWRQFQKEGFMLGEGSYSTLKT